MPFNSIRTRVACAASVAAFLPALSYAANEPPVLLGGTGTMRDMLDPTNTNDFRAAGGGLYTHQDGWVINLFENRFAGDQPNNTPSQNNRKAIVNQFKVGTATTVTGHAEYGFGESVGNYNAYYKNNGFIAGTASINGLSGADLGTTNSSYPANNQAAFDYIDTLKAGGISTVSIILSPNNNGSDATNFKFDNAKWDNARARAIRGGGWTSDAPPGYFFVERNTNDPNTTDDYRNWVIAETKWTNANGLKSTAIISPRTSGTAFFSQSTQYVKYFEEHEAIPKQWVVENYITATTGEPPAGYVNRIGSEDDVNELAYTAKWLINHVQGRPASLDLWSQQKTANGVFSPVGKSVFNTNSAVQTRTLQTTAGTTSTYNIRLENLGTNADTDFYAPQLSAVATGDVSHWDFTFTLGGVDVTDAVMGGGFTLQGADLLEAGSTGLFTMSITRLNGAGAPFNLNFFAKANPNATILADTISFASPVPEPTALALLGVGAITALRRRR